MKTVTININGKDTEITLTAEQIKQIESQQLPSIDWALEANGVNKEEFYNSISNLSVSGATFEKLQQIVKATNGGWVADWSNHNQRKYYPWFKFENNKACFYDYDCCCEDSSVPARLCFKNSEDCERIAKEYIHLYNDYLNG